VPTTRGPFVSPARPGRGQSDASPIISSNLWREKKRGAPVRGGCSAVDPSSPFQRWARIRAPSSRRPRVRHCQLSRTPVRDVFKSFIRFDGHSAGQKPSAVLTRFARPNKTACRLGCLAAPQGTTDRGGDGRGGPGPRVDVAQGPPTPQTVVVSQPPAWGDGGAPEGGERRGRLRESATCSSFQQRRPRTAVDATVPGISGGEMLEAPSPAPEGCLGNTRPYPIRDRRPPRTSRRGPEPFSPGDPATGSRYARPSSTSKRVGRA